MANIRLNFLPISINEFSFTIYRKLFQEGDQQEEGISLYSLPENSGEKDKTGYWVSFEPKESFDAFSVSSMDSVNMSKKYIALAFTKSLRERDLELNFELNSLFAEVRIEFTIEENPKGKKVISLSPYFLETQRGFGFLIDFKFVKDPEQIFDREVQRLSLSLDSNYRSNRNFYSDKFHLIDSFLNKVYNQISVFHLGDLSVKLGRDLINLPSTQLHKKEYIFNNKNTSYSQFQGIKNFGPYEKIQSEILFVFIFEERFKSFANDLYLSLVGKSYPGTFAGFEQMFKIQFGLENVKQIKLKDTTSSSLSKILNDIQLLKKNNQDKKIIGTYIEDYSIEDGSEASEVYYYLKYNFISADIPLQVINYRKLGERNALKWSTSNVALQMFSKIGGIPWIVKPSNNKCLILGIGSSHKKNPETGKIIKYFAYTVCLDSSGLYKKLEVLADEENKENYLSKLKKNLLGLLRSENFKDYTTCALHLPFKIKRKEIRAISDAINQIKELEFVVIKVNLKNKFFGFSDHNTLVPYESSMIQLSKREFLVWFEGLQYGKEIVAKRLSNPVHIEFLNLSLSNVYEEKKFLQDVLNLSGANWRGFNAKSIPISIYYAQIITEYTKAFETLKNYDETVLSNEKPWFL